MDNSRMNNLPFIAGMRATPRRIVKSFFIATVMGFLVINMNLLLRSVDDDSDTGEYYQGDPNYMGRVNLHPQPNGVEPIEPQPLRHHPRSFSDNNGVAHGNLSNNIIPQAQPKVQILPNTKSNSDSQNKSGANVKSSTPALPGGAGVHSTVTAHPAQHVLPPQMVVDLLRGPHKPVNPQNATFIKDLINKINHEQKIHNLDK